MTVTVTAIILQTTTGGDIDRHGEEINTITNAFKIKWQRWLCEGGGGGEGEGQWRWRLMSNNLTQTIGRGGGNKEEQQIQTININNRNDNGNNNNTFNSSEINYILLSYHSLLYCCCTCHPLLFLFLFLYFPSPAWTSNAKFKNKTTSVLNPTRFYVQKSTFWKWILPLNTYAYTHDKRCVE